MPHDFMDEAKIWVRSGDGGDGMMHFRREKFAPRGGPDGGDGGKGGDVVFIANEKINTLRAFGAKSHFRAENGVRGGTSRKTGAMGKDLEIEVPVGTIIREADTDRVLADLNRPNQRVVVLSGGRGGRGNVHWKNSRNQAPQIAENGDPGIEMWLKLELRILADVGLVGMPNAGKSTLLSVISNAQPKIADYPFTTLVPQLGVVTHDFRDTVVADIPGLVEGAAQGAGLGHAFLKHIQRTRLLAHLVDGTSNNPMADFQQINTELTLFDERLGDRPQLVVITKLDIPEADARYPELEKQFQDLGYTVIGISSVTHKNVQPLIGLLFQKLDELPEETAEILTDEEIVTYQLPTDPNAFTIEKLGDGVYKVSGVSIERAVHRTIWYSDEAVRRFQNILETIGITKALEAEGVDKGDTVIIGEMELEWGD